MSCSCVLCANRNQYIDVDELKELAGEEWNRDVEIKTLLRDIGEECHVNLQHLQTAMKTFPEDMEEVRKHLHQMKGTGFLTDVQVKSRSMHASVHKYMDIRDGKEVGETSPLNEQKGRVFADFERLQTSIANTLHILEQVTS